MFLSLFLSLSFKTNSFYFFLNSVGFYHTWRSFGNTGKYGFVAFFQFQFFPILLYFFDARYTLVIGLLPTLLLAAIVDCLTGPTIPVMQTMDMERTYSRALFTWIPIQLVMNYVLSSYLEADGAAIGYLLGRCLWNVMVVALIYRRHGFVMLPTFDLPSLPGLPRRPALAVRDSSSASVFPESFPGGQESSAAA